MVGTYLIADLYIKILYKEEFTKNYLKDYFVDSNYFDFEISVLDEEISNMQKENNEIPYEMIESLCLYSKICNRILNEYDGFLFHASAISVNGNAYLFTAPSGTGKSTHVKLLSELLKDKMTYINDDKPIIRYIKSENKFYVYGTPFDGKHRLSSNIKSPLRSICLLTRGEEAKIKKTNMINVIKYLIRQTLRWDSENAKEKYFELLNKMSTCVDFYVLACNKDISSAVCSYEGIIRGDNNEDS